MRILFQRKYFGLAISLSPEGSVVAEVNKARYQWERSIDLWYILKREGTDHLARVETVPNAKISRNTASIAASGELFLDKRGRRKHYLKRRHEQGASNVTGN